MGKRIKRYQPEELKARVDEWKGSKIQVLTWEDKTYSGLIAQSDQMVLVVTDPNIAWYNRKKHTHRIPWESIREIQTDEESQW